MPRASLVIAPFGCVWLRPHVQRRQVPNTQSARTPAVARSVREFIAVWLRLVGFGWVWLRLVADRKTNALSTTRKKCTTNYLT